MSKDFFNARNTLKISTGSYSIYRLDKLEKDGLTRLDRLPFSIRMLLESLLRQCNEREVTRQDVRNVAAWAPTGERAAMPYIPARVVMQDFSGVPAVVDLAAMRSAVARLGGDPAKVNPVVPVDLIVDHSVQVDFYLGPDPLNRNADLEFQRNG
jgi:aconitate hydratase